MRADILSFLNQLKRTFDVLNGINGNEFNRYALVMPVCKCFLCAIIKYILLVYRRKRLLLLQLFIEFGYKATISP